MKQSKLFIFKMFLIAILVVPCIFMFAGCADNGLSAYEIAVKNGFVGTETEWLASLKGEKGDDQTSVQNLFEAYKQNNPESTLTFDEWYEALKAELKGEKGESGETSVSYAANKAITSVASIYAGFETTVYHYASYPGFWSTAEQEKVYYTGAGVLFKLNEAKKEAFYITNYHVVYGKIPEFNYYDNTNEQVERTGTGSAKHAAEIRIYYYGMGLVPAKANMDKAIKAEFVGGSLTNDIAVIKISDDEYDKLIAGGVTVSGIGNSSEVHAGDTVVAIGNPEGEGISVTSGIISVDRERLSMTAADGVTKATFSVMRIDAAVNGGNSGGGLFDKNGKLIGIVNAKTVATEIEGMNYAIPVNLAINIANNVIDTCNNTNLKNPQKCTVGIETVAETSKAVYNEATKKVDLIETVKINSVVANSAAAKAGLKVGDIIKSFTHNGTKVVVTRYFDLSDYSFNFSTSGEKVNFEIVRNGVTKIVTVTLGLVESVD